MIIRPDRMPPGTTLHVVVPQVPGPDGGSEWSAHLDLVRGEPVPCEE